MSDLSKEGLEAALLPCPFCGGLAEHDDKHFDGTSNARQHTGHAIYCADMACVGCPSFSTVYETFEEAAAAWNRRSPPVEAGAGMREALAEAKRLTEDARVNCDRAFIGLTPLNAAAFMQGRITALAAAVAALGENTNADS